MSPAPRVEREQRLVVVVVDVGQVVKLAFAERRQRCLEAQVAAAL